MEIEDYIKRELDNVYVSTMIIKELKEKWKKNKTNNWMTVLNKLIILHGERV